MLVNQHVYCRLAHLTGTFKLIDLNLDLESYWFLVLHIIRYHKKGIKLYVLGPFHLQKFYRKYKLVRITQQKELQLIWNSETTQSLNIYLHHYQTETAIFLATMHEKTIMASSYLKFSIQKIHQNSKNGGFCEELLSENNFEAVLGNFCCYKYIIVQILLRQFRSKD